MVDIIKSPLKLEYGKKSELDILRTETDDLSPNTCKVVDVGKNLSNLLKNEKVLVCMGKDPNELIIKKIK